MVLGTFIERFNLPVRPLTSLNSKRKVGSMQRTLLAWEKKYWKQF
jgi:transposase-like protein